MKVQIPKPLTDNDKITLTRPQFEFLLARDREMLANAVKHFFDAYNWIQQQTIYWSLISYLHSKGIYKFRIYDVYVESKNFIRIFISHDDTYKMITFETYAENGYVDTSVYEDILSPDDFYILNEEIKHSGINVNSGITTNVGPSKS